MRQGRTFLSFMLILGAFTPINAEERALIDFTTYNNNIDQVIQQEQELFKQVIGETPELDIRESGYPDVEFEPGDWSIENWKVYLNASSDTVANNKNSLAKTAPSEGFGNVFGLRLQFQPWANAFWAEIKMPFYLFEIYPTGKFISQDDNDQDNGMAVGVLANVGQIKGAKSWVYGLNYKYNYGVSIVNQHNQLIEFGFGSVFHEGWRRLEWKNSDYISDVNDHPAVKEPLYPFSYPFIKFESLNFYKPEGISNPNFIGYVKDISLEYDLAIVREDFDINDEAIWQILATDSIQKKIFNSKKVAEELLLRRNVLKLKNANKPAATQQQGTPAAAPTQ